MKRNCPVCRASVDVAPEGKLARHPWPHAGWPHDPCGGSSMQVADYAPESLDLRERALANLAKRREADARPA